MKPLTRRTLDGVFGELSAHPARDADVAELVDPKLGIVTGFQDLLVDIEAIRTIDLGDTAPAQGVQHTPGKRERGV